jgi:hypothetical protein
MLFNPFSVTSDSLGSRFFWKTLTVKAHTLFYKLYKLKCNRTITYRYYGTKMKSEACVTFPSPYNRHSQPHWWHSSQSHPSFWVRAVQVGTWCIHEQVFCVHSRKFFASKSFDAFCEAFSSVNPDKDVLNRTTIHRLVRTFLGMGSVCDKCTSSDKTAEMTAYRSEVLHQLQQWDTMTRIQHCHWSGSFVRESVHV